MTVDANGLVWGKREQTPIPPDQINICVSFLAKCERTKTARRGSYGLKHVIERWADSYVCNGACIQAALDMGIPVRQMEWSNPNAWIGVSRRSLKAITGEKGYSLP